jgi:hypothetical protein
MPLFPPVTDTLRWDDLVREGRSQLPLVSPEWTDENVSDVGIAILELLAWLVETDSYRSSAVSDRERRRLLALAGYPGLPPQPATGLVRFQGAGGRYVVPAGVVVDGTREDASVPLTLLEDVAITGTRVDIVAWATAAAESDAYRSGCRDLSRDLTTRRAVQPFGPDPAPGDAMLVGLNTTPAGLTAGPLDLFVLAAPGLTQPEVPGTGPHPSVTTEWEAYDGAAWVSVAASDDTAALSRSGRLRLEVPALPGVALGDQVAGILAGRTCAWVRCRLVSGRHDCPPSVTGVHVDVGRVVAARAYDSTAPVPPGVAPEAAPLGVATGVPEEEFSLPESWCTAPPTCWLVEPGGAVSQARQVDDPVLAGAGEHTAYFDPDGDTVRLGDGRLGATLTPRTAVFVSGSWTTDLGVGELGLPLALGLSSDARTVGLLGPDWSSTTAALVAPLKPGSPVEDVARTASRAVRALWVHDRLNEALQTRRATSLDDLPLDVVRQLAVPERAVTAADFERRALATPGTVLWRARALPEVDPRLPGLRADGCVTVVVVPSLPVDQPEPQPGVLARIRADLAATRTLGTRVFVVGPDYVRIGVSATLTLLQGAVAQDVVDRAGAAVDTFLHPVTGGPGGRGWPLGRTVRRSEILQMLDSLDGVDSVEHLSLRREPCPTSCGDVPICPTQLVLAGAIELQVASGVRSR